MRAFEKDLSKALVAGLRKYKTSPRETLEMVELFNLAPKEFGLEAHEPILDMGTASIEWGGEGQYTPGAVTRTIVIRVTDYVSDAELQTVAVSIDGVSKGTTDANGELSVTGVAVGGHVLKLTKTGYTDSDLDTLFNDFIMVV